MVKILTVLVSTISNSQLFLLRKNISLYAIINDQSFEDMLTNNIIGFEQLGPDQEFTIFTVSVYLGVHGYA